MARAFRYLLLDVFAAEQFGGNPLAVFPDANGMTDAEMQSLARELNLSETTFCLPGADLASTRELGTRTRIFTTREELPFAGHPTLGTAAALRFVSDAWRGRDEVRLLLNAGTVPVHFHAAAAQPAAFGVPVRGVMQQPLPVFGRLHDAATVAPLLGLPISAVDEEKPIQTVSTGLPFVIVALRSLADLSRLRVDPDASEKYLRAESNHDGGRFFYVLAPAAPGGTAWRARMQFYGGEDPATGSAAGCATAFLVRHGYAPAGVPLRILQGVEMGRPSEIETSAWLGDGERVTTAAGIPIAGHYVGVGGSTVPVAEGQFFLR